MLRRPSHPSKISTAPGTAKTSTSPHSISELKEVCKSGFYRGFFFQYISFFNWYGMTNLILLLSLKIWIFESLLLFNMTNFKIWIDNFLLHSETLNLLGLPLFPGSAEIPRILLSKNFFEDHFFTFSFSEDQNFPYLIKFRGFCHWLVAALHSANITRWHFLND